MTTRDAELRSRAEKVFAGGMYGHLTTSKLPSNYPQFFESAHGATIRDVDGNEYLDYMCAWGPNLFGYGDPEINAAFVEQLGRGDTLTGPTARAVELGELLTGMISHADWAIFCKNGSDANAIALMVARAFAGKSKVITARGAYHGSLPWCSIVGSGVVASDRADRIMCDYNDVASLEAAVREAGHDLAAIFATPHKHDVLSDQVPLDATYARRARELCDLNGALLVVDDVRGGFRVARDCSWSLAGVQPDLSAYGKSMANGHPISALAGSDRARAAAASVAATGTFWYQAAPMAAALVALRRVRDTDYLERITDLGEALRAGLGQAAAAHSASFRQSGPPTMPMFLFDDDPGLKKGFFWSAEMLARGFYVHPWHNMFISAAMTPEDIRRTVDAADAAFGVLRRELPKLEREERREHAAPSLPAID